MTTPVRRLLTAVGALALVAIPVTASAAGGASAVYKPIIGKPVSVPTQAVAGKGLVVTFKVTRSDTGTRLLNGRMICDPSVTGKVIRHAESFKAGTARLAFAVPAEAAAKLLKVKVTIKTPVGTSATRVAMFRVQAGAKPSLSIADASAAEGNAGTTTLSFPVTLSAASTQTVSVAFATADGTATSASDYAAASGNLTFKPGEKAKSVTVSVVGDTAVEQDETFTVTLSNPLNATLADASATGTIANEDVAPRSGHYAGTTSQGRSIAFDVAPDLWSLNNLVFYVDLTCVEVSVTFPNELFDMRGITFPISPDWSFGFNVSDSSAEGSVTAILSGKLAVPGSATGTIRIDMAINTPYGVVHCSTGNVTWTASAA